MAHVTVTYTRRSQRVA